MRARPQCLPRHNPCPDFNTYHLCVPTPLNMQCIACNLATLSPYDLPCPGARCSFLLAFYPFCLRNNHEQHKEVIQNGFGVYHLPCADGQELEEDLERLGCSRQDFDWAVSLLHSRCFIEGPNSRHMTVPGIDMANHSFSPNASVR